MSWAIIERQMARGQPLSGQGGSVDEHALLSKHKGWLVQCKGFGTIAAGHRMHDGHELLKALDAAVADIKLLAAVEDGCTVAARAAPPEPSSTTVEPWSLTSRSALSAFLRP